MMCCLIAIMDSGGRSAGSTTHVYRDLGSIWGELVVGTRTYMGVAAKIYTAKIWPKYLPSLTFDHIDH